MKHKITAIIVEDSRLARIELKQLLKKHSTIAVVSEAENVDKAIVEIEKHSPDLIFLDINMPEKDGFALLQELNQIPTVIFTTAYDEYAIKAFEYNTFDYLLKPISQKRFDHSIEKLLPLLHEKQRQTDNKHLTENAQIFIKEGENCWMINLSQISLFEIMGNYTKVFFRDKSPLIYKSLNKIEMILPKAQFFRANRQQIINLKHISNIEAWFKGRLKITLQNGTEIEISRRQSIQLKQMLAL
jgi:two-component system LytT family response regulator